MNVFKASIEKHNYLRDDVGVSYLNSFDFFDFEDCDCFTNIRLKLCETTLSPCEAIRLQKKSNFGQVTLFGNLVILPARTFLEINHFLGDSNGPIFLIFSSYC